MENEDTRHQFCPRTINSWCKYQSDRITDRSTYKPSSGIPSATKSVLQKTFMDLSADSVLSCCLEGTSQNPNEAFNQIVWKKCPKQTFFSRDTLEIGVYSAILNHNDGLFSTASVLDQMKISRGHFLKERALYKDALRVDKMEKKATEKAKNRREKLQAIRKGFIDQEQEIEGGEAYCSGNF